MEYGKVKINYIPNGNLNTWISASLMDVLTLEGVIDYTIIDNSSKAIRIYPEDLKGHIVRCNEGNLHQCIQTAINKQIKVIIVNNFSVDYDLIKTKIAPLMKKHNIAIAINVPINADLTERIVIRLNDKILTCSDEEWENAKKQIEEQIKEEINKNKEIEEEYEEELTSEERIDLFKQFNLNALYEDDELEEIDEIGYNRFQYDKIKESYSHTVNDNNITISLTADNDIIINDGEEAIKINNNQLPYFINTLKNIINI